jgi:hypothetical protein
LSRGTTSTSSGVDRGAASTEEECAGGYDHALDGKYERYRRIWSSAATSSSATLWMTPLATATSGPPSSSFETSSPVDCFTTGGPAVKIAPWRVMTVKSEIGATSAP